MNWTFVWVVLWLATGGENLKPEPHVVAGIDAACDDPDFRTAAYHEAVERSMHKEQIISAEVWCDEVMAPAVPDEPAEKAPTRPRGST